MMLRRTKARRGAVLIESALIYPVMFLLMLAVVLLGIAVFRYQQVSEISREASRWASVHGAAYVADKSALNKTEAPSQRSYNSSPQGVYDNAVAPYAAGMQTGGMTFTATQNTAAGTITYTGVNADKTITFSITWNMDASGNPDTRPTRVIQVVDSSTGETKDVPQSNPVSVTVTYSWNTGLFGKIPVSSTSTNFIYY